MFLRRLREIASLRAAFPELSYTCLLSRRYYLPVRSVFGDSNCVLEIFVPYLYPQKWAKFRLLNPIDHLWADKEGCICYPEWMRGNNLLCLVESVISQFVGYVGRPIKLHQSGIHSSGDGHSMYSLPDPRSVDARAKQLCENPPKTAIAALKQASEDEVDNMLIDEGARMRAVYKCSGLSDMVAELSQLLKANETISLSIVAKVNKKHKLLDALAEKIRVIESVGIDADVVEDVRNKYHCAVKEHLERRMREINQDIATIREVCVLKLCVLKCRFD
ncbi:hypothetical protein BgAZ_207440 [Babesia gibsoni]|uniref:Uncharacterized protein n=1 Tax=Babesia gibsoni TaxID=33632 RepID=A0AAD8PEH8_BABGI|nr:hypothetical protein BgAZ_207440 [Babesia gibsoni]